MSHTKKFIIFQCNIKWQTAKKYVFPSFKKKKRRRRTKKNCSLLHAYDRSFLTKSWQNRNVKTSNLICNNRNLWLHFCPQKNLLQNPEGFHAYLRMHTCACIYLRECQSCFLCAASSWLGSSNSLLIPLLKEGWNAHRETGSPSICHICYIAIHWLPAHTQWDSSCLRDHWFRYKNPLCSEMAPSRQQFVLTFIFANGSCFIIRHLLCRYIYSGCCRDKLIIHS